MSYTNESISHAFFYSDKYTIKANHLHLWREGDAIYSYYTTIALHIISDKKSGVLILSSNNMSNTTSKHINFVRRACPCDVVYYPFDYGNKITSFDGLKSDLVEHLNHYKTLETVRICKSFIEFYEALENLNTYFNLDDLIEEYKETYKKACEVLPSVKKSESQAKRQKTIEENKAIKEKFDSLSAEDLENISYLSTKEQKFIKNNPEIILNKLQNKYNYLDLIKAVYTRNFNYNLANLIKASLNDDNYSFIWLDDDNIKTSRGIFQKIEDVKPFFKLWKSGKLKHGMKIDCYTVLEVTENYVKIGCHKIPTINLNEVYNVLFN